MESALQRLDEGQGSAKAAGTCRLPSEDGRREGTKGRRDRVACGGDRDDETLKEKKKTLLRECVHPLGIDP